MTCVQKEQQLCYRTALMASARSSSINPKLESISNTAEKYAPGECCLYRNTGSVNITSEPLLTGSGAEANAHAKY